MKSNRHILLFGIVTALFWFSHYTYMPTFSPYIKSLGASYKMIGIILGSYGVTQMLLRIPLGIISDRLNRRKEFVITGIVLAVVSSLGLWLFQDVNLILLFRSIAGASATAWVTFTVLYSSYYDPDKSTKAIGILSAFNYTGQVAGILIGSMTSEFYGPTTAFLVAFAGSIASLLLSFGIKENRDLKRTPLKISDIGTVLTDRNLILVSLLAVLSQFISFATIYGFTPVVAKQIGATDIELGLLTTIATIPVIFASVMSGTVFTKYLGERNTVFYGFIITVVATVLTPYATNIWMFYVLIFFSGMGRGLTFPLLMGLCIRNFQSSKRATAMGFFQAVYGLGMFIGPLFTGIFSDSFGMLAGFWATGLIGVIGAVITFTMPSEKQV